MRFGTALVCTVLLAGFGPTASLSQSRLLWLSPNFGDVDVRILLDAFAGIAKKKVIVDPAVKVNVSLKGERLTIDEFQAGIAAVLKVNGLSMEEKDGVMLVAPIQPSLSKQQ